jgi:hypothetical protein
MLYFALGCSVEWIVANICKELLFKPFAAVGLQKSLTHSYAFLKFTHFLRIPLRVF